MNKSKRIKGRTIVVAGKTWLWRVGSANVVAFSETEKRVSPCWEVKGCMPHDWDRGQWKRTSDGAITPADVARWLAS